MYDHYNHEAPNQNDKILCSVVSVTNLINIKTEDLYIPKTEDNGTLKVIYNSKMSKNLKKLYKIQELAMNLRKLRTCKLSERKIDSLREKFKIQKNTTRNAMVKGENDTTIFGIFKVQQNRFRIMSGPTIAPMHLLSYAVVHL